MILTRRAFVTTTSAALPLIALGATSARAGLPPVYASRGVAIDGSDAVAYFRQSEPVAGSRKITHDWMGVTWRFSSETNREAFARDPEAWAPQYGGYCAWAVSEGATASTVPYAWKIVDGKLYLNYSRRIQRKWERDIPARIKAADRYWPSVLNA